MLDGYYAYKLLGLIVGLFLIMGAIWDLYGYKQTGTIKDGILDLGIYKSMKAKLYATIFTLIAGSFFVLISIL